MDFQSLLTLCFVRSNSTFQDAYLCGPMRVPQYKTMGTNKKQLQKSELFPTFNPEMALHAIFKKSMNSLKFSTFFKFKRCLL